MEDDLNILLSLFQQPDYCTLKKTKAVFSLF